jgi:hypothetical protein
MRTKFLTLFRCTDSKRILTAIGAFALLAFLLGISPQSALAQFVDNPADAFQLESNATTESSICFTITAAGALVAAPSSGSCPSGYSLVTFGATTDDWQNALGFGGGASHALATAFVGPNTQPAEQFNSLNDTTFFGGGSKDTLGISSGPWEYKATSVQAKDDIEHAYAAAYNLANGNIAIYFGMDRLDNSGDATAGFWFVQDSTVGLSSTKQGGGFLWSGHHTNGDLLIVADFTTGGAEGAINAFTWSCSGTGAACDSGGSLVAAPASLLTNIGCDPRTGQSKFCAQVNGSNNLTAPWGFTGKPTTITTFQHGDFIEGGINLNAIFGSNVPCFSTFFAETRASTSSTASLSDVTPPVSFPLCGLSVVKVCNGTGQVSGDGTSIAYSYGATVTNDGIGALFNVSLHDTLPDGTETDIAVTLPDSCGGNACLLGGHSASVTNIPFTATAANCHAGVPNCLTPLSATNTATAKGFTAASGGVEIDSTPPAGTAECHASPSSSVTIEKHCDQAANGGDGGATLVDNGSNVVVKVFYKAKVCNTGTSQLTNINLADDHGNPLTHDTPSPGVISSLGPGACDDTIRGSYFPNSIDSTPFVSGRFLFTDTIRVTSATATLGSNPTPAVGCPVGTDLACAPQTCPICYDSVCTGQAQP